MAVYHSVGFVYVVSRFSPYSEERKPHLMLIGHRPYPGEEFKFGVPGGNRDRRESVVRNCVREFGEETGLLSHRAKRGEVQRFVDFFFTAVEFCNGSVMYGVQGNQNGFTSLTVVVDHAAEFEALVGISDVIENQWEGSPNYVCTHNVRLGTVFSGETQGLLWVPLEEGGYPLFADGDRTIAASGNPLGVPVLARRGVFGCGSEAAWNTLQALGP